MSTILEHPDAQALLDQTDVAQSLPGQLANLTSRRATLWLAPEPKEDLVRLQAALQAACPGCDDLSRFAAGFTPHLSVGQAGSAEEAKQLQDAWQRSWEPVRFEVSAIALLRRGAETPFEVGR
jgi:2'-5' RNA ligase